MLTTIPAPSAAQAREEWNDADFELPEGEPLQAAINEYQSEKDDDGEGDGFGDEDWDVEMDLGTTGGAKAKAVVDGMAARSEQLSSLGKATGASQMITIRPPLKLENDTEDEAEDDEGVSTIKVGQLDTIKPSTSVQPAAPITAPIDEDFEDAFSLPSDLTQLSLAPLTLAHRASKNSLEWGDRDHTSSSQSSDAYSTLGFADVGPSDNSASSASSLHASPSDIETDNEFDEACFADDAESELDGLVIPSGLFEGGKGGKQLNKILEAKKREPVIDDQVKVATPDPEDDFEIGLVINEDVDLSPSRLMLNAKEHSSRIFNRSKSMPTRPPTSLRPPSRLRNERAKSPTNPPPSSVRQFSKIRMSPSPPHRPKSLTRAQTFQAPPAVAEAPSGSSFLAPKQASVRNQKSQSALKSPTQTTMPRKLARKASLSSLIEASQVADAPASGSGASGSSTAAPAQKLARYETPTAASRAKAAAHNSSTSRMHGLEFVVPPTRPSTPSSNPAALRLTLPTTLRLKTRPSIASVFPSPSPTSAVSSATATRTASPLPPRPPSASARARAALAAARTQTSATSAAPAPKVLRRPKRARTYGDGTELDAFDDLPTDRDKEGKYRVQPKGYGNRVPGGSYPLKGAGSSAGSTGTVRKKSRRESSSGSADAPLTSSESGSLKRKARIDFPSKPSPTELSHPKKKHASPMGKGHTRRKPTLIRNLGGVGGPKVVGDMKWNPKSLRWEGNDQVLRDFDAAVGTSTRPALITHLTGSSIGSPVTSYANGARVVGNMIFDPARMCWISTLPPDEEEPDVFADLADDEGDLSDGWEGRLNTLRGAGQDLRPPSTPVPGERPSSTASSPSAPSPARSHTRTISECGSDRGSRASVAWDVDDAFLAGCRAAEERHRAEMRAWRGIGGTGDAFAEVDRSSLYDIRALATRKY